MDSTSLLAYCLRKRSRIIVFNFHHAPITNYWGGWVVPKSIDSLSLYFILRYGNRHQTVNIKCFYAFTLVSILFNCFWFISEWMFAFWFLTFYWWFAKSFEVTTIGYSTAPYVCSLYFSALFFLESRDNVAKWESFWHSWFYKTIEVKQKCQKQKIIATNEWSALIVDNEWRFK